MKGVNIKLFLFTLLSPNSLKLSSMGPKSQIPIAKSMVSLRVLISSFLASLVIPISQAIAGPEYQYTGCFSGADYEPNSTYRTNLNTLLSKLTSNTQINYGFYNSSYGQNDDRVYAAGLCRGDVTPDKCRSCLNNCSSLLLNQCPHQMEAVGVYDECMLHYAYHSIDGYPANEFWIYYWSLNDVTDWDQYNQVVTDLLKKLSIRAATNDSHPNRKFAAGKAAYQNQIFQIIYAVAQCQPDLTEAECKDCLDGAISEIPKCCNGRSAVAVFKLSCNLRYQNYSFYESTADELTLPSSPQGSPPSPPSPSPTPPTTAKSSDGTFQGKSNRSQTVSVITKVAPAVVFVGLLIAICIYLRLRKPTKHFESEGKADDEIKQTELSQCQFDFDTIRVATNFFSNANKLGNGGFGPVYKGRLSNEQEVAVKRLSMNSCQGDIEFKNEVLLMTRLQHRNLVRLLGFCFERKERLLVYEFLPNKSLDHFIFDPIQRAHLDWKTRHKIIEGIARGLVYLHEESQQRVIHRDIKASNILLDTEMNPKISDFGLARLFALDQTQANTSKIAGTLGYIAPEYARHGKFSVKSDVFSFGVLILEIVSGQKIGGFRNGENVEHLLSFAWKNWRKGTADNIIDPTLNDGSRNEIVRCIQIGLLCVQENVAYRPTLSSVLLMLNSYSFSLPIPLKPAFFMNDESLSDIQVWKNSSEARGSSFQECNSVEASANEAPISDLYPR